VLSTGPPGSVSSIIVRETLADFMAAMSSQPVVLLAVNTMRPFGRPEAIDQPPKSSLKNPAISAIMGQLPTG